jgi:putative copper export protein
VDVNPDPATRADGADGSSTGPAWAAYGRIATNFVHDLSTGMWFACLLVIWVVGSRGSGAPPEAAAVLNEAMGAVFWLLVASLAGIAVTGAVRLLYWRQETSPELVARKRTALVVKHVLFLVVYGAGTAWAAWTVLRGQGG